jgi:hypothetical protein
VLRTSISVAAAAIAATCALSACGPVRVGAAAIVGGQRITATTLTDEVNNLKQAYQAGKGKIQLQFSLAQAPQEVLSWMLRFKVRDELAARNHVAVSHGQSERALNTLVPASQGGEAALPNLAIANGLPPDMLLALGRYEAIQNAVVNRLDGGTLPKSNTALQRLSAVLNQRQCVAAKTLNISINPQFGQLDYAQLTVVAAASTLAAPAVPTPKATPVPELSPRC